MAKSKTTMAIKEEGPFEVLIHDAEAERPRWLELRQKILGASELPGILGMTRWSSPFKVWSQKISDKADPVEENNTMKWGKLLQDLVGEQTAIALKATYQRDERLLVSTADRRIGATLDGWHLKVDARTLAEIKVTQLRHLWGDAAVDHGGVPDFVWAQVQQQLFVAGEDGAYVSVLFLPERDDFYVPVERDQRFIDDVMLPAIVDFWHHVDQREPPPADGKECTSQAIKSLWAEAQEGKHVVLDASFLDRHYERLALKEKMGKLEQRLDELDNHFKVAFGDAESASIVNTEIRYTLKTEHVKEQVRKAHSRRPLRHQKPRKRQGRS